MAGQAHGQLEVLPQGPEHVPDSLLAGQPERACVLARDKHGAGA